jgi:hypothetical protein
VADDKKKSWWLIIWWPKKKSGAGFLVALILALAMASVATKGRLGGASADVSDTAVHSVSAPKSSAKAAGRVHSSDATDTDAGTDCAAHAYGEVKTYLRAHPCVGYARRMSQVRPDGGGTVLVAVSAVQMPTSGQAAQLRTLVDRNGSGNITELSRERGPFTGVRYDGAGYRSRQEGDLVVTSQAQVAAPGRSAPDLVRLADSASG